MFQSFETQGAPDRGPERLSLLRERMSQIGVDAMLVPRADAHQGEYVAPCDARLLWLTGFSGSAGIAAVTQERAAVFVDGRYTVQVRAQVDPVFAPQQLGNGKLAEWLTEALGDGGRVGFDPWLHTRSEIDRLRDALAPAIAPVPVANPIDDIWTDRPGPPMGAVRDFPERYAGRSRADKRERIAQSLREAGQRWAVLTLPDSIAWLLNIRGSDVARNPVPHGFALISDDGAVRLFMAPQKLEGVDLGDVEVMPSDALLQAVSNLAGPVRIDRQTAPYVLGHAMEEAGVEIDWARDPCVLPKACKTGAELDATRGAHLRDGAAMCRFLHWLEPRLQGVCEGERLTEIDVVRALEGFRAEDDRLVDIAFDTIAGAGPNGAIVHYRVTEATDRALAPGDLLLVDSGGQYEDGTTDVTRTLCVGTPDDEQIEAFTQVLRGMIAVSRALWPEGLAGRDLDALARAPLWRAGRDYDHGTGHGVGVALSVHEGPQRLSRASDVALRRGMILSNEPGYYREGEWGIRIENLVAVRPAERPEGGDEDRDMLSFETLTWVPIERRLIDADTLTSGERAWIDAYHADVVARIGPRLDEDATAWLRQVCAPL